jgi:hypothetical protein
MDVILEDLKVLNFWDSLDNKNNKKIQFVCSLNAENCYISEVEILMYILSIILFCCLKQPKFIVIFLEAKIPKSRCWESHALSLKALWKNLFFLSLFFWHYGNSSCSSVYISITPISASTLRWYSPCIYMGLFSLFFLIRETVILH